MDVTYVTAAQGALRPEEARERESAGAGGAFDLFLNLPSGLGAIERSAAQDREQERSREDMLAEREAASREVLDRRSRRRDAKEARRAQSAKDASDRSQRREAERIADQKKRVDDQSELLGSQAEVALANETQSSQISEKSVTRDEADDSASLNKAETGEQSKENAKPISVEKNTPADDQSQVDKAAANRDKSILQALLAEKAAAEAKSLEQFAAEKLSSEKHATQEWNQLLENSKNNSAKLREANLSAQAALSEAAANTQQDTLKQQNQQLMDAQGRFDADLKAQAQVQAQAQAQVSTESLAELEPDENTLKAVKQVQSSRMSGEVLSEQNRSGGQSKEANGKNAESNLNLKNAETSESSEWSRLFQNNANTTKGAGATGRGVGDSVQIGASLKGLGTDGSAGRGAVAGGVQDMPSVQLKSATSVASASKGQPTGQTLPEGVDEMAILRQISDGLRLKPGRNQTAIIRLNPAELGQVQVKVQVEGTMARIIVNTEHAAVGDLVSNQLDQLRRDILAQGVQVTHLEVRNELGKQGSREEHQSAEHEEREDQEHTVEKPRLRARRGDGQIDVQA